MVQPGDTGALLFVLLDRLMAGMVAETFADLDLLLSPDEQIAFVGAAWRIEDEVTALVLEAFAGMTPHKQVAKASRKALMQHKSYIARPKA